LGSDRIGSAATLDGKEITVITETNTGLVEVVIEITRRPRF
jgi:hypothetical protein